MSIKAIDHITLSKLSRAGAIHGAQVINQGDKWSVLIKIDTEILSELAIMGAINPGYAINQIRGWGGPADAEILVRPLGINRKEIRTFTKFETLVTYLDEVGISQFDMETPPEPSKNHEICT